MNKIFYNKFIVLLYFTSGMLFFILPVALLFLNATELLYLIPPIILILIGGYFYFRIFKALFHIIINKPMIEFTKEEYIDNFNSVHVKWNEIKFLSLIQTKSPFVVFNLEENSLFYNQFKNPIKLLFYKFEANSGKSFRTNIRFAKGKNIAIYNEIENIYKKLKK